MADNSGNNSILSELKNGSVELGEAFADVLNLMVMESGRVNPKAESFEIVPPSWKKLVLKPDKTPEEFEKLDKVLKQSIYEIAESYLLFIAKKTQNTTGKLEYNQYENYMLNSRFGRMGMLNSSDYINQNKEKIKNAFAKLSAHGEESGDNLIDKDDMAAYIYALINVVKRDANNKFAGFEINGSIEPMQFAVNDSFLFEAEDNMMSLKLRVGYKFLNGQL